LPLLASYNSSLADFLAFPTRITGNIDLGLLDFLTSELGLGDLLQIQSFKVLSIQELPVFLFEKEWHWNG